MAVPFQPRRGASMQARRAFLRLGGGKAWDRDPVTRTLRDGWIELIAWSHAVDSPSSSAGGRLPSEGPHQPLVITKPVDQASRRLMAALLDNEVFEEGVLEVWQPIRIGPDRRRPSGEELLDMPREEALERTMEWLRRKRAGEERSHAILLHNVTVARIESEMPDSGSAFPYPEPIERVSLRFERFRWSWGTASVAISIRSDGEEIEKGARFTISGTVTVEDRDGKPVENAEVLGRLVSGERTVPVTGTTDGFGVFELAQQGFQRGADTFLLEISEVAGFEGGPWKSDVTPLPRVADDPKVPQTEDRLEVRRVVLSSDKRQVTLFIVDSNDKPAAGVRPGLVLRKNQRKDHVIEQPSASDPEGRITVDLPKGFRVGSGAVSASIKRH